MEHALLYQRARLVNTTQATTFAPIVQLIVPAVLPTLAPALSANPHLSMNLRQIHAFARPLNSRIPQASASNVELIALPARV